MRVGSRKGSCLGFRLMEVHRLSSKIPVLDGVPSSLATWSRVVVPGRICPIFSGSGRLPRWSTLGTHAARLAAASVTTAEAERDNLWRAFRTTRKDSRGCVYFRGGSAPVSLFLFPGMFPFPPPALLFFP